MTDYAEQTAEVRKVSKTMSVDQLRNAIADCVNYARGAHPDDAKQMQREAAIYEKVLKAKQATE